MSRIANSAKRLVPGWARKQSRALRIPKAVRDAEVALGDYILEEMGVFADKIGGQASALKGAQLRDCIMRGTGISPINEAHQDLQVALTPHYEDHLYRYYVQQQYLILLTFLSYPYQSPGALSAYIDPYTAASRSLSQIRLLDYGAGMAFGLLHLLRTQPGSIQSITLADLDLVHTHLVEHLVFALAPDVDAAFKRVTDPLAIPDFGDRTFNMIYGKDVFEHLLDPDRYLRAMLDRAEPTCYCFFDFRDHGEEHQQHVSPQLSGLKSTLTEYGFEAKASVGGLSQFVRAGI